MEEVCTDISSLEDDFTKRVDYCRKNRKSIVINNASRDHAAYLIRNLIDEAATHGEHITIVSGTLDSCFYEPMTDVLEKAIKNGSRVDAIVTRHSDQTKNRFAQIIEQDEKSQLTTFNKAVDLVEDFPHFIVVGNDSRAYRSEIDHKQAKARASFNDPDTGEHLMVLFDFIKHSIDTVNTSHAEPVACN